MDTGVSHMTNKFEAMSLERDELKKQVTELREALETLRSKHDAEVHELSEKLEEAEAGKAEVESEHSNLMERVNNIRATLGERLKSNAVGYLVGCKHDMS